MEKQEKETCGNQGRVLKSWMIVFAVVHVLTVGFCIYWQLKIANIQSELSLVEKQLRSTQLADTQIDPEINERIETPLRGKRRVPGSQSRSAVDKTYIHWGRSECSGSRARRIFEGNVVGLAGSLSQQVLECFPEVPTLSTFNSTSSTIPTFTKATIGYRGSLPLAVNRSVKCSLCQSSKADLITYIGFRSCQGSRITIYSGYLMTIGYKNVAGALSSKTVCMDERPTSIRERITTAGPELMYVKADSSLVSNVNGLVPCAVCASSL